MTMTTTPCYTVIMMSMMVAEARSDASTRPPESRKLSDALICSSSGF